MTVVDFADICGVKLIRHRFGWMATQGGMCKSIHFVYRCRIWIGVPSPHSFASYQDPELLNKQKTNKNNATQVVHMVE